MAGRGKHWRSSVAASLMLTACMGSDSSDGGSPTGPGAGTGEAGAPAPSPGTPSPTATPTPTPSATGSAFVVSRSGLWSDDAAWEGDAKPRSGANVMVPAGKALTIDDCDVVVSTLMIHGSLQVGPELAAACPVATLMVDSIMVMGQASRLSLGAEDAAFDGELIVTLTGDMGEAAAGDIEERQLMIMNGGTFIANGATASKTQWTFLGETARAGDGFIELSEPPAGWEAGDELVIASTNLGSDEAERLRISNVVGATIFLEAPLRNNHFGRKQKYAGKTIDTRAEVGLLSHNIVIQGDEASYESRIGGHIMAMNDEVSRGSENDVRNLVLPEWDGNQSTMRVQGVELRRLGKMGRAGRYSFHWHLMGDKPGDYIRNSAVHDGFQRAVNVHGTNDVLVENVVAYNVFNHVFVPSEEGDEVRNVFRGNLGILSKRPPSREDFAFKNFSEDGEIESRSGQSEQRASVFWMRNTFNTLHDNRAAGAMGGQGFFLDPGGFNGIHKRLAYEASGDREVCDFKRNAAHSTFIGIGSPDFYTPAVKGFGLFMSGSGFPLNKEKTERSVCTFEDFEAYKTQNGGVWIEKDTALMGAIVTDSHTGVVSGDILNDVVVVGQSENDLPQGATTEIDSRPGLNRGGFAQSNNGGQNIRRRRFSNLTCVNLPACFQSADNKRDTLSQFEDATIENVTLIATPMGFVGGPRLAENLLAPIDPGHVVTFGSFTDVDGALTGAPGTVGSMAEDRFQHRTRVMENLFGWTWSMAPHPSEPVDPEG
ncbi:MAG: G8 domain-containing protein [Parvularculaceae bacterium]